jgi:putative oxygen-independent coproporphyrinogen III oxidase
LMSASAVDSLLATLRSLLPMEADAEITLEANPGTVEAARFAAYAASGINRLSLGIQSFNAKHLKALGRIHDSHEAQRAAELALKHFSNVNFDLMYALPQQTPGELAEDLRTAISFNPQHLSVYHLTLEPNTYFAKFPPKLPDDDAAADMQAQVEETLASHVYARYETSAYARAGEGANTLPRRSVHNTNYWLFGDYLGIGAGAHGKLSFPNRIVRQVRARTPSEYLRRIQEGTQVVEDREVKRDDLPFEFMMNALRLTDGFDASLFHARTGLPLAGLEPVLRKAEQRGLITRSHATIAPTQQGRDFLNDLLQMFL